MPKLPVQTKEALADKFKKIWKGIELLLTKLKPLFDRLKPLIDKLQPVLRPIEDFVFSKNKADIVVGVKIGHSNLVVIQVERKPNEYKILKCDAREIPEEDPNISEILKEIFAESEFTKEVINTSISGNDVIIRFIQYPWMNRKELKDSLEYEAEKYIPFNLSDVLIDFAVLEEKGEGAKKSFSLALVAAKREAISEVHNQFKGAEMALNAVDVDSFVWTGNFGITYFKKRG